MAIPTRGPSKRPAPPKEPPITLKDALDDEEPAAAAPAPPAAEIEAVSAALEPVEVALATAEPAVETTAKPIFETLAAAPVVETFTPTLSIVAATLETSAPKPESIPLDPSVWSLKALDLVSENAAAVLDLALALGQAKSVGEAVEAQSRFASERYSNFVKRANELVELSSLWSPFRFAVSAFVA
ncbi:phasin family protein [Methylosinus sp. Ce-a6]|uniref:phasin family protein n=1 Tax=Methylosinus sp. Ce-a6 TaxID=2172005 RepID=UPI0013579648|nr:phasin family protein [Methylosinus sp. Ce-a6]